MSRTARWCRTIVLLVATAIALPSPLLVAVTYLPGHPHASYEFVVALLVISFFAWLPILARVVALRQRAALDRGDTDLDSGSVGESVWQRYEREDSTAGQLAIHLRRVPSPVWLLGAITGAISAPTLLIGLARLEGDPTVIDHHYFVEAHGSLIPVSHGQYAEQVLIGLRIFPSGAAIFLLITMIAAFATLGAGRTSTGIGHEA